MGDRLGTPGVVDFSFFSQIFIIAVVAATSNDGSNLKTCDRNCRRSQIKKSKLILVTAFKVGFHFFFIGFRLSIFGWAGILLTNETITLQTLHCEHCIAMFLLFFTELRKIGMRPDVRLYRLSTAIPR